MPLLLLCGCSFSGLVRETAAYDFSCPEEKVTTAEVSDALMRADGCGKDAIYNRAISSPLRQAVFDLQCPASQLRMIHVTGETVGVEGCGKRVSYVFIRQGWVANSAR